MPLTNPVGSSHHTSPVVHTMTAQPQKAHNHIRDTLCTKAKKETKTSLFTQITSWLYALFRSLCSCFTKKKSKEEPETPVKKLERKHKARDKELKRAAEQLEIQKRIQADHDLRDSFAQELVTYFQNILPKIPSAKDALRSCMPNNGIIYIALTSIIQALEPKDGHAATPEVADVHAKITRLIGQPISYSKAMDELDSCETDCQALLDKKPLPPGVHIPTVLERIKLAKDAIDPLRAITNKVNTALQEILQALEPKDGHAATPQMADFQAKITPLHEVVAYDKLFAELGNCERDFQSMIDKNQLSPGVDISTILDRIRLAKDTLIPTMAVHNALAALEQALKPRVGHFATSQAATLIEKIANIKDVSEPASIVVLENCERVCNTMIQESQLHGFVDICHLFVNKEPSIQPERLRNMFLGLSEDQQNRWFSCASGYVGAPQTKEAFTQLLLSKNPPQIEVVLQYMVQRFCDQRQEEFDSVLQPVIRQ